MLRALTLFLLAALAALLLAAVLLNRPPNDAIPQETATVPGFIGTAATPKPLPGNALPSHPFLAAQGNNSMHNDSYQSDAYPWAGPLGRDPQVQSRRFHYLVGSCVASTFDRQGRIYSTCVTPFGVTLIARDPESLDILASQKITTWLPIGNQFSGGVYYHLDHQDRVLLATNDLSIQLWRLQDSGSRLRWVLDQSLDIGPALNATRREKHAVIDVMPDWSSNYWFITRAGLIGVSDREGHNVQVMALEDEGIDNALAIGRSGVFVVSSHAMYALRAGEDGAPRVLWREAYDRGSGPKPGTMGWGSGTTPTLVGDDYVAITDNADGRVNVMVYRQAQALDNGERVVCKHPVFSPGKGTTENSLSAVGRSLIIENNFGYQGPFENFDAEPGIARIDIRADGSGCDLAWENREISSPSAVPKVSLATGLIYLYTRDPSNPADLHAWYFTALDFETGALVYKALTGVGRGYNNHYGSITLAPDGSAYVGVIQGMVVVRDACPADAAQPNC